MIAAVGMCKDEADVIGAVIAHLLTQVDEIIVADNGSTDGTREILHNYPIIVIDDPDPAYRQSAKMSALAARAAQHLGATWVVPFDSDEIWYHPELTLREFFARVPDDRAIVTAELFDHVATGDDPDNVNPIERLGWRRRTPAPLRKVAARPVLPVTIHQGNHGASYEQMPPMDGLTVRHFPYRSVEQMERKVANGWNALKAAPDLPESSGRHWRDYAALEAANPGAIGDVFREWFWEPDPEANPTLIFDPCPQSP